MATPSACVIAVMVFGAWTSRAVCSEGTRANDGFAKYSVPWVYHGPMVMPDFQGRDHKFQIVRTRLRQGLKNGADFSDHYKIIQIGCGANCLSNYIVDVSTGQVYEWEFGDAEAFAPQLEYSITSRLIRVRWNTEHESFPMNMLQDYVFERGKIRAVDDPVPLPVK